MEWRKEEGVKERRGQGRKRERAKLRKEEGGEERGGVKGERLKEG